MCIVFVLTYWQVVAAPRLNADRYNTRQKVRLMRIEPGTVYTADGTMIIDHKQGPQGWEPMYPEGRPFAHLTGYSMETGLQRGLRDALYGQGEFEDPWRELLRGGPAGNDVVLTIDSEAQRLAIRELEREKGAIVALDARTGAVLVLASSPGYDPAQVTASKTEFDLFRFDPTVPELNRAIQGLYPPGSVFKIFTAAVALDLGLVTPETTFNCRGEERIAGTRVTCRRRGGHGRLDLNHAMADSCNIVFAQLGDQIGTEKFREYVKRFHLLDKANLGIPSNAGRMYDFNEPRAEIALVEAAFGQGATLLTPLAVARMTATIANGGTVLQPYIMLEVRSPEGQLLKQGNAQELGEAISAKTAAEVAGMMVEVVESGTGRPAALRRTTVAGKTGSAENPHGAAHAWFAAFAPAENPQVVVAVILEGGGAGGANAGPIARRIISALLGG